MCSLLQVKFYLKMCCYLQNHSPFNTRLPVISLTCDLELIGTIYIPDTTVAPYRHAIQHSAGICELDLEVHVWNNICFDGMNAGRQRQQVPLRRIPPRSCWKARNVSKLSLRPVAYTPHLIVVTRYGSRSRAHHERTQSSTRNVHPRCNSSPRCFRPLPVTWLLLAPA